MRHGGTGMGKAATNIINKASKQARLPSRRAMAMLMGKDPAMRAQSMVGNFSKMTPSGAGGMGAPSIMDEGQQPVIIPALSSEPPIPPAPMAPAAPAVRPATPVAPQGPAAQGPSPGSDAE